MNSAHSIYQEKRDFERRLEETLCRLRPDAAPSEERRTFWDRGVKLLKELRQSGALKWNKTRRFYLDYLNEAKALETKVKVSKSSIDSNGGS